MKKIDSILRFWYPLVFALLLIISFLILRWFVLEKLTEMKMADLTYESDYIHRHIKDNLASGLDYRESFRELKAQLLPYYHIVVLGLNGRLHYCMKTSSEGRLKDCDKEVKGNDLLYQNEIKDARHSPGMTGYGIRYITDQGKTSQLFYFAKRYPDFILGLAMAYRDIPRYMSSLDTILFSMAGLISLILILTNTLLVRLIVKPIRQIMHFSKSFVENHHHRVEYSSLEEIALLQKSLNETAKDIQNKVSELSYRKDQVEIVIKNVSEGVLILDKSLRVMLYNQGLFSLLNINEEVYYGNLEGKYYYEIIRNNALNQMIEKSADSKQRLTKSISIPSIEGAVLEVTCIPILHEGGMVLFIDNVTEQYKLVEIKKSFVENASHEFKTPISIIKGYLETLLKSNNLSVDEQKTYLQKVLRNADRLNNLIKDLVTLNKLDESRGYFTKSLINVVDVIEGCLDALSVKADSKEITLVNHISEEHIELQGNLEHLEIIFFNLIDNAITYTDSGGKVEVEIEHGDKEIVFLITDTGIGIPAEHRDRIFERFYRVDEGRSRKSGGTGLGLSIVKHAVSFHEGDIVCRANPTMTGTQFKVCIPLGHTVESRIAQLDKPDNEAK